MTLIMNIYVQTQVKCARGRADMVVLIPDAIYMMKPKLNSTKQSTQDQIKEQRNGMRYVNDTRRVIKVEMGFSIDKRKLTDYLIVEV